MLMLKESQIQKTEVLSRNKHGIRRVPGVYYKDRLFTQNGSFDKEEKEKSLEHCRQLYKDDEEKLMVLLVENEEEFSVWVENSQVKLADPRTFDVASMPLKTVVSKMRNVDGIKIKDRTYHLKTYPACFVGTEAVRWFMHRLKVTHADALRLGQRLIEEKWIHHVSDDHDFKDEDLFYRFFWDEA